MKNNLKKLLIVVIVLCVALSLASCKGKKKTNANFDDEHTIRISYSMAGYGDAWIKQAVSLFNSVFEEKGYHAQLDRDEPNNGDTVVNEVKYPDSNEFDLYIDITENAVRQFIDASYSVLKTRKTVLLEDLQDVYNSHPLDTNGNEEPELIKDSFTKNTIECNTYYGSVAGSYGKLYSMQWTNAVSGMMVNTEAVKKFGYEIPRTTKELQAICDDVITKNVKAANGQTIYPITWPGYNASGYIGYATMWWLAQWKGVQGFNDFYSLTPADGNIKDHGYEVYDDIGIQYALGTADMVYDSKYCCNGTLTTIDHLTSDQILADGEALFAVTGDWTYNELINLGYTDEELNCIECLPLPVMSEIAQKINLPGANAAEQDACLSNIIKLVDEGKTDEQIMSAITGVTKNQVAKVRESRGIYMDTGIYHIGFIPQYANCIEGAKLFLRFIASKDFAQKVYGVYAHGCTANKNAVVSGNNFLESLNKITKQSYSVPVGFLDALSTIRLSGAIGFVLEPAASWPDLGKGMAGNIKGYEPETLYTSIRDGMKKNWASIISTSGVYDED